MLPVERAQMGLVSQQLLLPPRSERVGAQKPICGCAYSHRQKDGKDVVADDFDGALLLELHFPACVNRAVIQRIIRPGSRITSGVRIDKITIDTISFTINHGVQGHAQFTG